MVIPRYFLLLVIFFSLSIVSAVAIDNPNIPIVKPDPVSLPQNVSLNISVDSANYWDTDDHGLLGSVSELYHNWLGGLQGGSAGEYYHFNSSIYNYILSNVNDWTNLSDVTSLISNLYDQDLNTTSNVLFQTVNATNFFGDGSGLTGVLFNYPHDQELNTTDNVIFNSLNLTCSGLDGVNESCLNVSGDAYFRDIHARDAYFAASTVYIGNEIRLTESDVNGTVLSVEGGNLSAQYFYGSGQYLTDINLTDVTIDGGIIVANNISAIEQLALNGTFIYDWSDLTDGYVPFTGATNNLDLGAYTITANNFFGIYDWTAQSPYLNFNGTYLTFDEAKLNNSFVSTTGYSFIDGTLNVTNIFADNLDVLNLTADQLYAINITAGAIDVVNMTVEDLTASTIFTRNFTVNGTPIGFCLSDGTGCENASVWTAEYPYLNFNGSYLTFNQTQLQKDTEVTLQTEVVNVNVVVGVGTATTAALDFEIKEIYVSCSAGTKFRFEASETLSGDIIDKNRKLHNTDWRIEKNYPIDDTVDLSFSSVNPSSDTCSVTIKYLDNFN